MAGLAVWTLGAIAPVRADITTGLVAYYPFNSNVNDASGSSNNGTLFGPATFTNTPYGTGLDFPGQAAHHLDLGGWLNFTNFTIGIWVYPRAINPPAVLIDDNSSGGNNWVCQSLDGTNYVFNGASFFLSTNQWSYVVLEALTNGLAVFVNGQLTGSNSANVINYLNAPSLSIGAGAGAGDQRDWNGIVSNLRIYNRALSSTDVAQLYASETVTNSSFAWSRLCSSNQVPAQFYPTAAGVDYVNGIVYSARKSGALIAYNLASNTFTTLPTHNGPGGDLTSVYDSTSNRILAWGSGRGPVYAISATGGVWQALGGGAQTSTDFSNFTWWNPFSSRINTFGGYGGFTYRNWLWEFDEANHSWTQGQTNFLGGTGRPWPRNGVNSIAADPAGTRLFLWGGSGTSNGVQYSLDPGFYGWDNDGKFNGYSSELFQDLWVFNYAANSWNNLVPVSSKTPQVMGPIVYHPSTASILLLGGQTPPADAQTYSKQVYQLRLGQDSAFAPIPATGTPPATFRRKNFFPVAALDAPRDRAFIVTDEGIHALTPSPQAAATISVIASPTSGGSVSGGGAFTVGSLTNITATANSFWIFTGWIDGNTNATRTITVPLSGATYTANFKFQTAVITVGANPVNGGTVSGSGTYAAFSARPIQAYAINGWHFTGWSDGNTQNPRMITVQTGAANYTAEFATCTGTLAAASTNVTASAGSNSVQVTTLGDCAWTATSSTNWLFTSSHSNGNGRVSYTFYANYDGRSRTGTITVLDQTFTITQAAELCTYTLAATSTNVSAGAGGDSVGVTTLVGCPWTSISSANWLHTSSSGTGSGALSYTFDANPGNSSRSGTITLPTQTNQTFIVNQAAANCTYALTATSTNVAASASTGNVEITALAGCPWGAISNTNWLHTSSSGIGTGTLRYSVDNNTINCSARSGTITVGGQTFTVTQAGGSGSDSFAVTATNVAANAGSGSVRFSAGIGCPWSVTNLANWVTITNGQSGNGSGTISYTFDANPDGLSRSNTFTAQGRTFTITQAPATCTYTLAPTNNVIFAVSGGTGTVNVLTLTGCVWTATSHANWLTIISGPSGTGAVTVSYVVADNSGNCTNRTGILTIGGQTNTVTQDAGFGSYALASSNATVTAIAGSGSVSLTAGLGCPWLATSGSANWLHTTSSGTGNGTVNYTFDSNSSATNRSGTITVHGQILTVQQRALTAIMTVLANPANGGTVSGGGSYTVSNNVQISARANNGWTFTGWSDGSTNAQHIVRITDGGATYTANFSQHTNQTATLTVQANPGIGGTVSGGGTFAVGNQQQIAARANSIWRFASWSDGNSNAQRLVSVPANDASYTANFVIVFPGTAPVIVTPPIITNSLLVIRQQFMVVAGETNIFSVGAADPVDDNLLRYQWRFGDATNSDWSSSALATHVYATNYCGPYTANVTVSNLESAVSSNLTVSVACQLPLTKLQLGLNFAKTNADSCALIAKLNLAGITNLTQLTAVQVDVADAQVPFALNSNGRGTNANGICRVVYTKPTKTKPGFWTLTVALRKGTWSPQWGAYGLTNATISPPVLVTLPVGVLLGKDGFATEKQLDYRAIKNQTGTAK